MDAPRDIVSRMQEVYFSDSWPRAIDFYHDDAMYTAYMPEELFPKRGERRGKAEILDTFAMIHERYAKVASTTIESVMEGDRLAQLREVRAVMRDTGRVIVFRIAEFFICDGDRIREHRQVLDTFDLAEQVLGREIPLGKT